MDDIIDIVVGFDERESVAYHTFTQSVIERNDAPLASYLGLSTGHWRRIEEAETARQEVIKRMQEKTEELKFQNQQKAQQRQKDLLWNQTHGAAQQRIIR